MNGAPQGAAGAGRLVAVVCSAQVLVQIGAHFAEWVADAGQRRVIGGETALRLYFT